MIDTILDFAIDHAPVFAALLMTSVIGSSAAAVWAYGRLHERQTRRRGQQVIS